MAKPVRHLKIKDEAKPKDNLLPHERCEPKTFEEIEPHIKADWEQWINSTPPHNMSIDQALRQAYYAGWRRRHEIKNFNR